MEIYFSTDVETDGPIPGPNSMLSFGTVALDADGKELGRFYRNLTLLPDAVPDASTAEFWAKNKEAYEQTRTNQVEPERAMREYVEWVLEIKSKHNASPVFVAYPAGFDFLYMYWYMIRFAGKSPFSFSAIDIKTYAMAVLKKDYRECTKRNMPKKWFPDLAHTHNALDDALEQGMLFINILKQNLGK